ncbi:hypothetical protein SESBI_50848 [Sesbania bispinosa]|nr:hypothetical protein SESBI_50848 [Sesbania bispinosa]
MGQKRRTDAFYVTCAAGCAAAQVEAQASGICAAAQVGAQLADPVLTAFSPEQECVG